MRRCATPAPLMPLALAVLTATASLACGKTSGPLPLCRAETIEPGGARELTPELWFANLLPDYDRDTRRVRAPARDCTGATMVTPTDPTCRVGSDAPPLADRPLGPDDLVLQPLDDDHALVWIVTRRFADGDGLGPAALIEWGERGFFVRATGPLRAPLRHAQLRLEPLARGRVLVVDADRCVAELCRPVTVLVPLISGRFTPMPVRDAAGACDGPAELDRARTTSVTLGSHVRRFSLSAALRFEAGGVLVDEQVVVVDSDTLQPDAPAREFRRVAHSRRLDLEKNHLVDDRPALWAGVIAIDARVDGGPAKPP